MFIKKFEADTLDNALKTIKSELGPDAIILKTVTNKGLKGAFKKKKIEITAAISEKSYSKKSKVDKVLNEDQRKTFYASNADNISEQIDNYNQHPSDYGSLGLNRNVLNNFNSSNELDDFLSSEEKEILQESSQIEEDGTIQSELVPAAEIQHDDIKSQLFVQKRKIDQIEKIVEDIIDHYKVYPVNKDGLHQLKSTLNALDINEKIIFHILKKAPFELTKEQLKDEEILFEFALREIESKVNTSLPLFARRDVDAPVITVLLSEAAAGQSSCLFKLGSLVDDCRLIQIRNKLSDLNENVVVKLKNLDLVQVDSIPELVSECRNAHEKGMRVFVDYRNFGLDSDETKKFISGLRRGLNDVEVIVCLSSIHSEIYNRKQMKKFASLADGVIFNHLDLCLNYSSILNVHFEWNQKPLMFFGTGQVIPDDIESATAERIIGKIFDLDVKRTEEH